MKIGVLTSSRSDYGIYKLLLSKLSKDNRFDLTIIVFGMHLQKQHGETIKDIESDAFGVINKVQGMPVNDLPIDISKGYGKLIIEFSKYMQSTEMVEELQIPVWLTLSFLLVAIWSVIIMAHIFSKVMSKPTYSMLVAIAYLMVNFLVQSLVLGL